MNLNMKEIGKRISDRRKKLGIKQNILAEKLDISNNHMSGIENGKATPSVALFVKICDELNVTPDFLLLGSMHSNRVSKDASDLLQKCSDQEIEMIMQLVQHFVELREQKVTKSPSHDIIKYHVGGRYVALRILFCDDDSKILAQLQKYVCEYFEKGKLKRPEMKVYVSGEELLKAEQKADIAFLDVEMPGRSGIYVGAELMLSLIHI